jgi:hypothetical protein
MAVAITTNIVRRNWFIFLSLSGDFDEIFEHHIYGILTKTVWARKITIPRLRTQASEER